ncbi:Alcohol dehydrogenase, class IV [Psychrobacter aquaticus CMS 56]|uniref:Alcohol dehydrogenase, class IV n=1 Tax=Psychrobacter aquaticus CMS 56 TaxID=1354303 RepID=U4T785_9GAMM|nr:Alcohol dehydrogenase, class IV [Psychrobacter aquaticus CMS 56]
MASDQDLAATDLDVQIADATATKSTLATMQADMDAALKDKQHADTDVNNEQKNSVQSNEFIAQVTNDVGDRVLDEAQVSRVIEMAWEDRTPFGAIEHSYGLTESDVIKLMRQTLKPSSFKLWRERVSNRATKHEAKRGFEVGRAYCKTQYKQR